MSINIGLTDQQRQVIAKGLAKLLADTYTLYLKTHNYHWNVTGPQFSSLHLMFEGQYTELSVAVDDIAERIRALGVKAPGSYREFSALTAIKEAEGNLTAEQMVSDLMKSHETVTHTIQEVFPIVDNAHDEATLDLLNQRTRTHEKTAWMLRSIVE